MKKFTAKLRTKSFWVALIGALTLILTRFGVADASAVAETIMDAVGSILLLSGVIASPAAIDRDEDQSDDGADIILPDDNDKKE